VKLTHASEQGLRPYQEDRFFTGRFESAKDSGVFLAVMDGHDGQRVAQFCIDSLSDIIYQVMGSRERVTLVVIRDIIKLLNEQTCEMESGTTLSLAFISYRQKKVFVGVLGDSPVIIKNSQGQIVVSSEHNARTNLKEREAAIKRGACYHAGYICEYPGGSGLQMTRSLGDREFKNFLNRLPELYSVKIGTKSFVALLSDGIVDPGHRDSDVLKSVISMIEKGASASDLVQDALDRRTEDNATAIVWVS
jgi:serine/threonine protein phosphatase PrpC